MIRRLVRIPSISSADPELDRPNRPVIDLLATFCEDLGFTVAILDVPGRPGKANLIARLGSGEGGLVLAGHTDTVPFDEGAWRSDPFELTEREGHLYGLGTADMKGFFAAALHASLAFSSGQLEEPLVLVATADEESTMAGARALVAAGEPRARRAIVGEPTNLRPIRAHKGIVMERITLRGRSGHSSDPSLGTSALEGMHEVISEVLAFRADLARRYRDDVFAVPTPTLNLGRIEGGDAANRICGRCELDFDLRPLPGMSVPALRAELRQRLVSRLDGIPLDIDFRPLVDGVPPFETPATAETVVVAERLTGQAAGSVLFCTEGPFFASLGMETLILGPGDIAVAHQPDENLPRASIAPAIELYAKMIHRFCVDPETT